MGNDNEKHLQVLHEDVIAAFERIHPLLIGASGLVDNWSKNPQGVQAELDSLSQHLAHVRELELVMPVVAPMKAGKSSLINAIVGYQLLPARANPMTTLPTKIVLVDGMDLDQPELEIPASLQNLYTLAEEAIYKAIQGGWKLPDGHSYLNNLAMDIANQRLGPLKRTHAGISAVHSILARLNDQMRMLAFADPDLDLLNEVEDLPVLRTGSLHSYQAGDIKAGRLVIIDTPGPNENAIAARLSQVLERQLANSHVVLVVLDYTQMGSDAAQDIRDRLSRHLAIIGPKRLFAVVNKVDARKSPSDLSREDTYENARNSLNLTSEQAEGRIFETVAHWGVIGSHVVAELASPPKDYDPAASKAVLALWKELRPLDDAGDIAAELRETSVGRVEREARKLLNRSGVADVVDSAISRLREGAAPTVMAVALDRYIAAQSDLREVLELERSGAEHGQTVVREQLANLDKEIALLAAMRAARPAPEALQRRFSGDIDELITMLRHGGEQIIATLDAKEPADQSLPDQVQGMVRSTLRKVKKAVWRDSEAQETREFNTLTEAEAFMDRMGSSVVTELNPLLDWGRSEANRRIEKLAATVVAEQEAQVSTVLERAAQTLKTAFDVKLTVPKVAVDTAVEVSLDRPATRTTSGTREYTETEYKRTFRRLWIVKSPVEVKKYSSWSTTTYLVSKADVQTRITTVFNGRVREIRQALMGYLAGELDARLADYYDRTDQYLQRYHSALNRSQDASAQDEKEKQERLAKLAALAKNLTDESRTLDDYSAQLAEYGNAIS
ncbi:MAG: dynamin family protein [Streptosporangiaceae bacterium]|jgi:predicted GTPase